MAAAASSSNVLPAQATAVASGANKLREAAAIHTAGRNVRSVAAAARTSHSAPQHRHDRHSDRTWLERIPFFRGMSAEQWAELTSHAKERQLARRQNLFSEGEVIREVSLLCSGRVKITQLSPGGLEVILNVNGPGEIIGGLEAAPGSVHHSSASALEPSHVLTWTTELFENFAERIPLLRRNAVSLLSHRLRTIEERFRELATEQVAVRVARMLLRLLEQIEAEAPVCIRVSREELAQMTGTTLFTVSRLLSLWERDGIVGAGRQAVHVRSLHGLRGIAESCEMDASRAV